MKIKIIKNSALEETSLVDNHSVLPIRVSTTARKEIRESGHYSTLEPMSNPVLNEYLAGIFKSCGKEENILHYFLEKNSTKDNPVWIEVRFANHPEANNFGFSYFFSVIRESSVDIIGLYSGYKKPEKARKIKMK